MDGASPTPFMWFFVYVWVVWTCKALGSRRYRPWTGDPRVDGVTVLVPVYNEPEAIFRRSLASVRFNQPSEMIAVVDGGDARTAEVAAEYCDQVVRIARSGKRAAIGAGLEASDPSNDVVVVLDSDTVWEPGALRELLRPFDDPRVGGVTPQQAIFDAEHSAVRA